jgi:hypothetical protein
MIYLLRQIGMVGYDQYDAKIIRASSEYEARKIANETTGDEGQIWTDSTKVSCVLVKSIGKPEAILESFCAG